MATKVQPRDPTNERPYARYAFLNPYNLLLFAGTVVAGALTGHTWLVVVASATEALWLIFAPDSKVLRAVWFDPVFDRAERAFLEERLQTKISKLDANDRARVARLDAQKSVIEHVAKDNPGLAVDLLHDELAKLSLLIEDFVDLASTAGRAEQHAQTFDFNVMRRSWLMYEEQFQRFAEHDARREVAAKNLSVLRQRRARYDDLIRTIEVSRGQMELIEQTFRLLGDEIMTMSSPTELSGRIDELRLAVDAVRETANPMDAYEDHMEIELEECHEAAR